MGGEVQLTFSGIPNVLGGIQGGQLRPIAMATEKRFETLPDVPTFKEVEEKIQARYTRAKATSELNETSVESRVLEVEQATANVEAQSRLSQLRSELGLESAAAPAVGHTQPATDPATGPAAGETPASE